MSDNLAPSLSPAVSVSEQVRPLLDVELLDVSRGFGGMGRSHTFPFPEYRARDEHRTVFFDVGEGHPIVFVHGMGGNATHFEHVARRLVKRHRVIGLDLVGFGWSAKPDRPYTLELLRDHLLSFVDRRGLGRFTLVGHSMGGAVALAAALARPGQVDSLALLCAAGLAPLPRWMRVGAKLFVRRQLLYPMLRYGADFIVKNVFVDKPAENEYVQWFRDSAMRDAPGAPNLRAFARVTETLAPIVAASDFSPQLPALPMPVLAVWGDGDKLTLLPNVLRAMDRIPRVRSVVVRSGHLPMIERPEETSFQLERLIHAPPR
jgi:pimeloyl-ACP methyl ester carboxylesterase